MLTIVKTANAYSIEGDNLPAAVVRMHGQPAVLGDGWVATSASKLANTAIAFNLRHLDGRDATWILDPDCNYLAGTIDQLPEQNKAEFLNKTKRWLDALAWDFLNAPGFADRGDLVGLFDTSEALRNELIHAVGMPETSMPDIVTINDYKAMQIRTRSGFVDLDVAHVSACIETSIDDRFVEACRTGVMTWTSPVDGLPVDNVRGFPLFSNPHILMVWRCVDERNGLVFFVLAAGFSSAALSLWIPVINKIVVPHVLERGQFSVVNDNQYFAAVLATLFRFGRDLVPFLRRRVARFGHYTWPVPAVHVGHYHWNELPGLAKIVDRLDPTDYPIVFDMGGASGNCFYERLTEIFPELGQVIDLSYASFDALQSMAFKHGIQLIKFAGSLVSSDLRKRIARTVSLHPASTKARDVVTGGPVVVFGLRVENRTIANMVDFYASLGHRIADHYGSAVLLIDGHNTKSNGKSEAFISNQEEKAAAKPITIERKMMADLLNRLEDDRITVMDCVGMTLRENLAWMQTAEFCVAPWGAGLAKYRWALDIPSYILSSRYCMQHKGDMNIYSHPDYIEMPSRSEFVSPDLITDRPDLPVLIDVGGDSRPYYANFIVDVDGAANDVIQMMDSLGIKPEAGQAAVPRKPVNVLSSETRREKAREVISRFESLGGNCEFGFVQQKLNVNVSSLFRWAEIPSLDQLNQVIRSDFEGVYLFENLEPFNHGMVRDRTNWIAWHSSLKSDIKDQELPPTIENHAFVLEEEPRRQAYEQEFVKVSHLINKTRESIRNGNRIYVYKPIRGGSATPEQLRELVSILNRQRNSRVLYVTEAPEPGLVGTVTQEENGLLHGYVDRFAPGDDAGNVSLDVWVRVCENALNLANA